MKWKIILGPVTVPVTKELAQEFVEMERLPHDRPAGRKRLAEIRRIFDEGEFRTTEWASCYVAETNKTYRVNGKHTSIVMSERLDDLDGITIVLTRYSVETLDEAAQLYASFDPAISAKSASATNQVYAGSIPALNDARPVVINNVIGGIAYYLWEDGWRERSQRERAALLKDNAGFAVWYHGLIGTQTRKYLHVNRVPVVAAMYATYRVDREFADLFWREVMDGIGGQPDSPVRRLHLFLQTHNLHSTSTTANRQGGAKGTSRHAMMCKCVTAWNAWRLGKPTKLKYFRTQKTPKAV